MSSSNLFDRVLFFGTALLFLGIGVVMEGRAVTHHAHYLVLPGALCIAAGLGAGACYYFAKGWFRRWLKTGMVMFANTAVLVVVIEAGCHLVRVDFNSLLGVRSKNDSFPIYYRMPAEPVGEVFFKREGNVEWTGRPLSVFLKNHRGTDLAYEDEAEVTIRYDEDGFRNPRGLSDWEVAVAGDSFTESGYLEEAGLFTSVLGQSLGVKVKNLGVSDTGNFTQACYLEKFGESDSLQAAVLAFFEGNDLDDNVQEMRDLSKFRSGGGRPSREIGRESSFVRVLYRFVRDFEKVKFGEQSYANADFSAGDTQVPVSIADAPPAPSEIGREALDALDLALDQWVQSCKEVGAEPWLLYVPCKRRVFDGLVTQRDGYPVPGWELNGLPQFIREKCEARGIKFADPTPALAARSREGVLTFNTIYDTHLNAEGHRIVGEVLAESMAEHLPGSRVKRARSLVRAE